MGRAAVSFGVRGGRCFGRKDGVARARVGLRGRGGGISLGEEYARDAEYGEGTGEVEQVNWTIFYFPDNFRSVKLLI